MKLRLTEVFYSIQGEGRFVGRPSVFVRLFGCDQACGWCDSKYSWESQYKDDSEDVFADDLGKRILDLDSEPYVVFTGGEPVLWGSQILEVMRPLHSVAVFSVETSGTQWHRDLFMFLSNITVSPKMPSSGMKPVPVERIQEFANLGPKVEFKFAVADQEDFDCFLRYGEVLTRKNYVSVMPVTTIHEGLDEERMWNYKELVETVLQHQLKVNILPRLHVLAWGAKRGV